MNKKYLIIFFILLSATGCEKNEKPTPLKPPKKISILSGNNQIGYAYDFLPDTIVLEITPENADDLNKYSFSFEDNNSRANVFYNGKIIDDKLYIHAAWQLSSDKESQEMKFYIREGCEDYLNCRKIDSLTISATVKPPWTKIFSNTSGTFYDIHFSDESNGILVGDLPFNGGYFKTNDGGNTWTTAKNARNDLYQLSFSDNDTGIVIVSNNYAYFTNNGGQTFSQGIWAPPIIGHRSSSDYFMFNSRQIITVGQNATIAKSIDGGKSWSTYQGLTFKNYLYDITCPDQNTCYACGSIGKVVKTSDGGQTWKEQEILINSYLKKIYFIDNEFGFAGGQYGSLIRTTNGGATWDIISTGISSTIIEIYFLNRNSGYLVGSGGEIEKTNDGGLTWEMIVKGNYGVYGLTRAVFNRNVIFGIQAGSLFKYEVNK